MSVDLFDARKDRRRVLFGRRKAAVNHDARNLRSSRHVVLKRLDASRQISTAAPNDVINACGRVQCIRAHVASVARIDRFVVQIRRQIRERRRV